MSDVYPNNSASHANPKLLNSNENVKSLNTIYEKDGIKNLINGSEYDQSRV